MADKQFVIKGTVVDKATGNGLEDLYVEAWDEHGAHDKTLGSDTTNKEGKFTVRFGEHWFKEVFRETRPDIYFLVYRDDELLTTTEGSVLWNVAPGVKDIKIEIELPKREKVERNIYLQIERILHYSPVEPNPHYPSGVTYRRDCMRNTGHLDGTIPEAEVEARMLEAIVYREYLDADYLIPKVDKIVSADINEPVYDRRVPGTVIWAHPGEILNIHVLNTDNKPHTFHIHGVEYGIDSDGAWPFGTESLDGRRSDEICSGQSWTYRFCVTEEHIGVWPFHDHWRMAIQSIDRGLFGGLIVLPKEKCKPPIGVFEPIEELKNFILGLKVPAVRLKPFHKLKIKQHYDYLKEWLQLYIVRPTHCRPKILHVPLFFHFMRDHESEPLWNTEDIQEDGGTVELVFDNEGSFDYFCIHHGEMTGTINVVPVGFDLVTVEIRNDEGVKGFFPEVINVAVGGTVRWINNTGQHHTATSRLGASQPTHCFNGRGFVGNSPTVVGRTGQKIRWYVLNLDIGKMWHNFHTHSQRWKLGDEIIDVRSIGPAESFIAETKVPSVILLTEEMEKIQDSKNRPGDAQLFDLKGDFLFHCHVHHHLMNGMVGVVRAKQSVWLTPAMVNEIQNRSGLPLDDGTNSCPDIDMNRCESFAEGKLVELANHPQVIMMHAAVLPNTNQTIIWGKTRTDQCRLYDYKTNLFTVPATQPAEIPAESPSSSNLWSAAHAFLDDEKGTLLAHGALTADERRRVFLYDPATKDWRRVANTARGRFYATTFRLANGKILTMFGTGGGLASTIEVYDPATNTWSEPKEIPFNYYFYPWTYLLPDGKLFVAGPQMPSRRFDWTADLTLPGAAEEFVAVRGARGPSASNMQGTSVLLTLQPPDYAPKILMMGGAYSVVRASTEIIDLKAAFPAWEEPPNWILNHGRTNCTAVLLPDGRVVIAGGMTEDGKGGPIETLDPWTEGSTWVLGPITQYPRLYHSSMILLPDGSVLIGGDDSGADPCERFYPGYCFMPRPKITGAPVNVGFDADFDIQSPDATAIAEVVLMHPGAVTHGFDMSQRAIELEITGAAGGIVSVKSPLNGNVAPSGHYMMFILNGDRVPSEARWIRLMR